ncbi:hypothetical protein EJ08DRAFT_698994 [Tothia fuscella]|uniref:F-box domain-containing protein n=1 Tax=Tothia fuscella TaxID=1048955 RepID=A0A9P4NN01_9PEZI|nr:hypothetical protein EJ08DRAFT_698994 [Tothia fuscella]
MALTDETGQLAVSIQRIQLSQDDHNVQLPYLPPEIVLHIFGQVTCVGTLFNICLCSSAARAIAEPILYKEYFDSTRGTDWSGLRSFLLTLIRRPQLAEHVRSLEVAEDSAGWGWTDIHPRNQEILTQIVASSAFPFSNDWHILLKSYVWDVDRGRSHRHILDWYGRMNQDKLGFLHLVLCHTPRLQYLELVSEGLDHVDGLPK